LQRRFHRDLGKGNSFRVDPQNEGHAAKMESILTDRDMNLTLRCQKNALNGDIIMFATSTREVSSHYATRSSRYSLMPSRYICLCFGFVTITGCATVPHRETNSPAFSGTFDAMHQPGQVLRCRSVTPPSGAPAGAVALEFEDGVELVDDRLITAVYDSTGDPLSLQMLATENRDSRPLWHAITVAYPTAHSEQGVQIVRPANSAPAAGQESEDLSAGTLGKARTLSNWLWNHRCRTAG
jgi:hypothetical protein